MHIEPFSPEECRGGRGGTVAAVARTRPGPALRERV